MRKAQAALEFLTTYGWAFIVILVMIGALAYFGVLNPSKVTPNRCIVEAGFECREYRITQNDVNIVVYNRKGTGMQNIVVNATSDVGDLTGACTPSAATLPSEGNITIACTRAGVFTTSLGNKVKVDFTITYTAIGGTLSQVAGGSVYTQVQ